MSKKPEKLIQDLIMFYVKENYNSYLSEHNLDIIPEDKLETVIESLYSERKRASKRICKRIIKENNER